MKTTIYYNMIFEINKAFHGETPLDEEWLGYFEKR